MLNKYLIPGRNYRHHNDELHLVCIPKHKKTTYVINMPVRRAMLDLLVYG